MAGTTTNYAIDYPTSTDLVRNGATAMQTLATDVDTLLFSDYLPVTTHVSTTTSYSRASGTTTFGNLTGAPTQSITTGKSGKVVVILTADCANGTTANGMALSYTLTGTGGSFTPTYAKAITTQNARTGASFVYIHSLAANTTYTLTLQAATLSSTGSLNCYNHSIQSINIG